MDNQSQVDLVLFNNSGEGFWGEIPSDRRRDVLFPADETGGGRASWATWSVLPNAFKSRLMLLPVVAGFPKP